MNSRRSPRRLAPGNIAILPAIWLLATGLHAQTMQVSDRNAAPVVVESAALSTEITGRFAVTTFDLVFRNPNGRVLEGTFEFPLLEGQSVVRFALDIGGTLREAVPVEKNRGRAVFEEIERRGVDPGLLEQTAGNNYRARVYPIPANGTRRIVIAYQEDLARAAGGSTYRLALDFKEPLKRFSLAISVMTGGVAPAQARTTLPVELPDWEEGRRLEITRSNFEARGLLELEIPAVARHSVVTERRGKSEYFYAELPAPEASGVPRPAPAAVGVVWDASGSGRERDRSREFAFLDAWFAAVPDVEVRLVLLRDHATQPAKFAVRKGDWSALRRELENVVYDGASSIDGLVDLPGVGEWLLFSDGLFNYGVSRATERLPLSGDVHALMAGTRANPAILRGIAHRHAGEFVNLIDTTAESAVARLRSRGLRVLGIDRNPEHVAEVFPEINTPVAGNTLVVTGRLLVPSSTIRVKIGHSDSDARTVELSLRAGENPGHLAARAWATVKIALLSVDSVANREDIRRTSEEFGIVTADTSLIVLETLEDYLRYDIAPPEELRTEWSARRAEVSRIREKSRQDNLGQIAVLFAERVKWWETKFPKDQPAATTRKAERDTILHAPSEPPPMAQVPHPAVGSPGAAASDEETVMLSPFEVSSDERNVHRAHQSLAGRRARTQLRGGATGGMMRDVGYADGVSPAQDAGEPETAAAIAISLERWNPKAGYLERLRRAKPSDRHAVYLEERPAYARMPGFFLDVAGFFLESDESELGLRILSNLAELELEDPAMLRVLAQRLVQAGRPDLARPLLERVLTLRPDEPQSLRDLALVCAALKDHQRAIDLLWQVVERKWDDRFPGIGLIALGELNAIAASCGEKLDLSRIDARLRRNLPVGLRVVLTWDADSCDIDLWVDDPNGEKTFYSAPLSYQGGRISRDFTLGYGPEEFLLRDPKPGKYTVRINYFGDGRQTALGPVTAQVLLITGFGTPQQEERRLTVRLEANKETLDIGSIVIGRQ